MADVNDVTVHQFLSTLFPNPKGVIDIVEARRGQDGELFFIDHNANAYDTNRKAILYYCISTCETLTKRSRKPSRKHPVETHVIVLDDIGTKVAADKISVPPTYALETSPGNFQLGYRLTNPVDPDRGRALMDALARAGLTDKATKSNVRVMRIPGSWNGKPQHGDWRARLTTWKPDLSYTFSELANLLGVTPTDTPPLSAVPDLEPGQVDPVAEWILAHQGEPGGASGAMMRGLIPVICPQTDLHTVGLERTNDSSTVWKPGAPGYFKCTHAHCENFRTAEFLAWIRARDPSASIDRPATLDGLAAALRKARERAGAGDGIFAGAPKERSERVADAILSDLIAVGTEDRYYSLTIGGFLSHKAIDDHWTHLMRPLGLLDRTTPTGKPGTPMAPHMWLRGDPRTVRCGKLVHKLAEDLIVDGDLNIAPPLPTLPDLGAIPEPEPWLELVDFLCEDPEMADHLLDWLALVVGAPRIKPGWHVIIWGGHGTGKNLMMTPVTRWLGNHHFKMVSPTELSNQFNGFLTRRLLALDELEMNTRGSITAHDVYNTLKPWTALGNETFIINEKYRGHYIANNLSCWIITSNSAKPLPLEVGDRRFLVIEAPRDPREAKFYDDIVAWGDAGGYDTVIAWLADRWATMSASYKRSLMGVAPMTAAKARLIDSSAEGTWGAIRLITGGRHGVTWPQLMTMDDILEACRLHNGGLLPEALLKQLSQQRLIPALRAAGWVQLFDGERIPTTNGSRVRLWCQGGARMAGLFEQMGRSGKLYDRYISDRTKFKLNKL